MTRARILADYVAGGTTAAEFDHIDGLTSTAVGINDTQTLANKTLASTTVFPSGHVINTEKTTTNTLYNIGASTTHMHLANFDLSITPTATSSWLIIWFSAGAGMQFGDSEVNEIELKATKTVGGTETTVYFTYKGYINDQGGDWNAFSPDFVFWHAPSTTSAITFKFYGGVGSAGDAGHTRINEGSSKVNSGSVIIQEIAG